jgi:excisionase family DNA binding protein
MKLGEVARYLRVSNLTVKRLIKKGKLKGYKGEEKLGWWYVTEEDLQEYLRSLNPDLLPIQPKK